MKSAKCILAAVVLLSMVFPVQGFSEAFRNWQQVLNSSDTVNIYVENIVNVSADSTVNADTITEIVKGVFSDSTSPKFYVVGSKSQAGIVSGVPWGGEAGFVSAPASNSSSRTIF